MLRKSARIAFAIVVIQSAVAVAASQRLAVADADGRSIAIIDVNSGKGLGSISVEGSADKVLASSDGKRIVAISRGAGKTTWLGEFRPTTRATATVIDGTSMKILQRVELGWDASDAQITNDGKMLVVLSPGVDAKPPDFRPASLWVVDLTRGTPAGKADFDRLAQGSLLSGDQKQAVVYFEGSPGKRPTLVRFVDLVGLQPAGEIAIDAKTRSPAAFEGHDFIYLLDPPLSRAGTLYVVSASQRKLVGSYPVGLSATIGAFDEESGRLFVLSQSASKGERGFNGQLDVFKNGAPLTKQTIVDYPANMTFTPDRKLALISGVNLEAVPLDTLQPERPVKCGPGYEIHVAPDQKRAYLYEWGENRCCFVTVFDLPSRTNMKSFLIGSKGARFGQAIVAAAATAGSYSTARSTAKASGASSFYYTVYTPRIGNAGRGMMVIRPDGKFAYAIDPQTSYITVIDGESGERLSSIAVGAGAREAVAMKDASTIAVLGSKSVTFFDTKTNDKRGEATFTGEVRGFETSADRTRGVAITDGRIAVYDEMGNPVGETVVMKRPAHWVFLP